MKTKTIRAYEETIAQLSKEALMLSAEREKLITTADLLKEIVNDYLCRRKNKKRTN